MAPLNPLIPGFAPDPTILQHNNTFYLINSSFHLFPGLPIYSAPSIQGPYIHISNALSRRSQLTKLSLRLSSTSIWPPNDEGENMLGTGGLYAPTLRFHSGTFYLVCTNVIHNEGSDQDELRNFILSTTDIEGEWSDPVYFDFHGIDPSLFWDDDGKCYVQGSASPGPATRINQFQIDLRTGEKLSEEKTIWEGVIKFYPEGPHLYKKNGWYYVMIAEGGTHEGHMIEMARARDVWGPYEARLEGAILPPAKRGERVQYTGHGDLVQDGDGKWWAVCLGVRKMGDGNGKRYIMGRETFLTAAEWEEGQWPKIFPVKENLEGTGREVSKSGGEKIQVKGTADLVFLRDPVAENYQISGDGNAIKMKADVGDFKQWKKPTSFVGRRQRSLEGQASVSMKIGETKSKVKAGFAVHKDEHRFAQIYYDRASSKVVFEVLNAPKEISRVESKEVEWDGGLSFKIVYTEGSYEMTFGIGSRWSNLGSIDTAELSGPDFVGPVIGAFAIDGGEGSMIEFEEFRVD